LATDHFTEKAFLRYIFIRIATRFGSEGYGKTWHIDLFEDSAMTRPICKTPYLP